MPTCRAALALLLALIVSGCGGPPVRITMKTADQVSICRNTETAEFQEAEDMAARFCGERRLLPKLAGTSRCARHSVQYDYICTAPRY